ncbi:DMT family transporter [Paracrocinitomix mangrovi]|uniref:DMT family transporter n=1 Tax=Paracrocinitomix mangrovi TaxID=2862509 RepID=UPI001C8E339A|nr:DMT family transporter [Paracrocinitomix mangrovi]UKN01745.1 DMT family transporter [Paracrocinitomix mangrovi]
MIDLVLGIVFFSCILVLFKLFERFKVDNLQAIVFNYVFCVLLGFFLFSDTQEPIKHAIASDWKWLALSTGFFFVVVFNLLASGAQKVGITISTIANKMSMLIPVVVAIIFYNESSSVLKIIGILLALVGVYLVSTSGSKLSFDKKYLWLIIIIFVGQGIADVIFNYSQKFYVEEHEAKLFISSMFSGAFLVGFSMLAVKLIQGKSKFHPRNILWGLMVAVPNFLTVYFFYKALESGILEASRIYPILNMGVIILSAVIGLLFFNEKLSPSNWFGVLVSLLAIALITFG